jgi:hypothetical protein
MKGLDLELVERELARSRASFCVAARRLGVGTEDLRRLVWGTPVLRDAVFETLERGVDEALSAIWAGLRSEKLSEQLKAAKAALWFARARGDLRF